MLSFWWWSWLSDSLMIAIKYRFLFPHTQSEKKDTILLSSPFFVFFSFSSIIVVVVVLSTHQANWTKMLMLMMIMMTRLLQMELGNKTRAVDTDTGVHCILRKYVRLHKRAFMCLWTNCLSFMDLPQLHALKREPRSERDSNAW